MNEIIISHASLDDLRKRCEGESRNTIQKLKGFTSSKCMKYLDELYKKTKNLLKQRNLESGYIGLRRCLDISECIMSNSDFSAFKETSEGSNFYRMFAQIMEDFSVVDGRLRELFAVRKLQEEETVLKANREKERMKHEENNELDDTYIQPIQLFNFVKRGNTTVLIIDYRSERMRVINYAPSEFASNVCVVMINPLDIRVGSILSMLAQVVDISDRPRLLKAASFDLVVFIGDKTEVQRPLDQLSANCATKKLMIALTTHNNSREKLKRTPLILEDGFESWNYAYPAYTRPINDDYEEPNEKFDRLLAEAFKVSSVDVEYPHLVPSKGDAWSITYKDERSCTSSVSQSRSMLTTTFINDGGKTITSPESSHNVYPAVAPQRLKLPTVDRSTKPSTLVNSTDIARRPSSTTTMERLSGPTGGAVQPSAADDLLARHDRHANSISVVAPPQSCAQEALRESAGGSSDSIESLARDFIQLPTLAGGARPTNASLPTPHAPPMPDRSTKTSRDYSQNDLQYFNNVYEVSMKDIFERSKRGSVRHGHTGLYNMRNTCFMNTTLQALFNTPGFASMFMNKRISQHINIFNKYGTKGVISGAFSALMDSVWSGNYVVIRPSMFLEIFVNFVNKSLGDHCQHDAQEFQIFLLDALHEDSNKINIRKPFEQNYKGVDLMKDAVDYIAKAKLFSSSVIGDFFDLRMVSRLSCTTCQASSATFEEMNQISLELPSSSRSTTLRDSLCRHFEDILLEGWNCPTCKIPRMAGRSTRIWTLPPVLIVHMKRFSLVGNEFVKNEISVDYEVERLSLADFVHEQAPRQNANYSLYAVTNHSGRLNSGHYTAYIKNFQTHEWLRFDDDYVSSTNTSNVKTRDAFILYYTNLSS